ncbi:hypothetical protein [Alsobacter sp. R-9]
MSLSLTVARLALSVLPLIIVLSPPAARATEDVCTPLVNQMGAMTIRYRTAMAALRGAERELGARGDRNAETVLRAVRGYEALQRDAMRLRAGMLDLYGTLDAQDCSPFDAEGLSITRNEFERLEQLERQTLRRARSELDGTALR